MGIEQGPQSRLPEGGTNLFQSIKLKTLEAEGRGIKIIRLSIGQPQGPALESARIAAAEAVMSDIESMHEYQDNGSPGIPDFARRFIQTHVNVDLERENVDFLPIPGIKPMFPLIPLACGGDAGKKIDIVTTTNPGYPTPKDWAKNYWGHNVYEPALMPGNEFVLNPLMVPDNTDLVMMNYPHNPSGQVLNSDQLSKLCAHCEKNGIRLFNDAAYVALSHDKSSTALTDVAVDFPDLSWAEAYSASKVISNGTGWRIGAMAGSPDFISDLGRIKGNTDSGFAAPLAVGVLYAVENDRPGIEEARLAYERRLGLLTKILLRNRMERAVAPKAGFFSLWKTPREAFGQLIRSAEQFNFLMIEKTGVVGVHFEPYMRYAVTGNIEAYADSINSAFREARVSYK